MQFSSSIYGDDGGSSKQRFSIEKHVEYVTLNPGEEKIIKKTEAIPPNNSLLAVTASVIEKHTPINQYLWGREHLLSDAISTLAGLNLNLENLPDYPLTSIPHHTRKNLGAIRGLYVPNGGQVLSIPEGRWELKLFNLNGVLLYSKHVETSDHLLLDGLFPEINQGIALYFLSTLSL